MSHLSSFGLLLTLAGLAATGCSHGKTSSSAQIAVAIRPDTITMAPGQSVSFVASVSGSSDTAVVWSVKEGPPGGSVSAEGLYTAPTSVGTCHVVATSHADPSRSASAAVTVTADAGVRSDSGKVAPVTHVSRDSSGWTVVLSSADTRIIRVSSSTGKDTNDGSEGAPMKTLAAASRLLRSGYPDWLLLKAGDTWTESFSTVGGRSADEPILISSYGSGPRPQIRPTSENVIDRGRQCPHIYLIGLDFYDARKDPSSPAFQQGAPDSNGIYWVDGGDDILVEDCSFRFLTEGIIVQGDSTTIDNVRARRNVVTDMYTNNHYSQGSYFQQLSNLLIEDNVFDHNAWVDSTKVTPNEWNQPNLYDHHVYIAGNISGLTVRGNFFLRDSSLSLKLVSVNEQKNALSNGLIENNLFFEGEVGIAMSVDNGGKTIQGGGSSFSGFRIQNNVLLQTNRDNPTGRALGFGMDIQSTADTTIRNNIFSDFSFTDNSYAISLGGDLISSGITIQDNLVYRVRDEAFVIAPRPGWSNIKVINNTIQDPDLGVAMIFQEGPFAAVSYSGNVYSASDPKNFALISQSPGSADGTPVTYDQWVSQSGETGSRVQAITYPDPGRNLDTYVKTINPSWALADFYRAIRTQAKSNWHPEYTAAAINDYVRAGFGVPAFIPTP